MNRRPRRREPRAGDSVVGRDPSRRRWRQRLRQHLLFLLVALIVTVTCDVMGLRRKERFPWLAYVALALWVLPLVVG